jgi:hypothetical protein
MIPDIIRALIFLATLAGIFAVLIVGVAGVSTLFRRWRDMLDRNEHEDVP